MWGVFSLLCLFGVFYFTEKKLQVKRKAWLPVACLFWGLWAVHAMDGQISIPLLVIGLMAGEAWVAAFYPTKIFTIFPVLVEWRRFLKDLIYTVLGVSVVVIWVGYRSFHGQFGEMFREWGNAAISGAHYLNAGQTRGPKNQSLTVYFCKVLHLPAENTSAEVIFALAFFSIAFFSIQKWMKHASSMDRWIVALALTPVFHPLPWEHMYVWTFPLAACSLNEWLKTRDPKEGFHYFGALFLLTLSNSHAIPWLGAILEANVGRAWGALWMSISWIRIQSQLEVRNVRP